ncbi:RNA polymerase factor sigma-54 [Tabrizicola sp.]|uniref:RNA polymerase factor sigma-54 n=1 Tax=Tabrizicola sp. TaxID=2005166 RepID=UPI0035B35CCE
MTQMPPLHLRHSHSPALTPQMLMSIRLLQLAQAELERFVNDEVERNPLLDRAGPESGAEGGRSDDGSRGAGRPPGGLSRMSAGSGRANPDFDLLSALPEKPGLRQRVEEQIGLELSDPLDRLIAVVLADALDEAGYFRGDMEAIAGRLGVATAQIARVLAACQQFAPTGIFARNLSECLALQLRERDRLDPAMAALLAHLDLVARRDFACLKRICKVDDEDLCDMLAEIRSLDPRPGSALAAGEPVQQVVPDVEVLPARDGWRVELTEAALPRVLINGSYAAQLRRSVGGGADRDFITTCLRNANWLVRSLDQRAHTILKVATEIVRQQDDFLTRGVRHLKPLTLKMVADGIGINESTVSRVTANKFMRTPRGVFELKYFFTVALGSLDGQQAHSAKSVLDQIRQIIDEEKPENVLSDDAIVRMLQATGIVIARRTVTKYREAMRIAPSGQRRREKRMAEQEARLRAGRSVLEGA